MILADIIELMETRAFPYFELRGKKPNSGSHFNMIMDNRKSEGLSVKEGIEQLKHMVDVTARNQKDFIFEIKIKESGNASTGTPVAGPFEFTVGSATSEAPYPQSSGLSGLGAIEAFKTEVLAGIKLNNELMEPRLQMERERTALEWEKRDFEREKKAWEEWAQEREEELEQLAAKYQSRKANMVESLGALAEDKLPKILASVLGTSPAPMASAPLSGTQTSTDPDLTPEEELLDEMCTSILEKHEEGVITSEQIETICKQMEVVISQIVENQNSQHGVTSE